MRRLLGSAAGVVVIAGALAACSLDHESDGRADPAPSESVVTPAPTSFSDLRVDDVVDPQLFGTDGGLVLVASALTADGSFAGIVTSARSATGWTPAETLSTDGATTSSARVALNPSGAGAAVWTESTGEVVDAEEPPPPPVVARVRRDDGTWAPAEPLPGLAYVEDVQVNARGDLAVLGYPDDGLRTVTVRPAGGAWKSVELPEYDAASIALDEAGGVHAATTGTNRGGGGPVSVTYLPPGGTWTTPQRVPVENVSTDPARMLVLPDGGEALLVGTVSPNWQSTFDTQLYWSTKYQLLRRDGTTGPFTERWSGDGATDLHAEVEGSGVRLTWAQNEQGVEIDGAEGPTTVPTRTALLTRGPDGVVERITETPVSATADGFLGGITFAVARGCGDEFGVIWRTHGEDTGTSDLEVRFGTDESSIPDERDSPIADLQAALACADGEPWLARAVELEQAGSDESGDRHLSTGAVTVDPLG